MEIPNFKIDNYPNEITKQDLLEVLEKMYFGKPSQFILSACYDVVVAFIKELRKDIESENK